MKLYVVGFPKSGNTWLTRLLARILDIKVKNGIMHESLEVATEVNYELIQNEFNSDSFIAKVHFLPSAFRNEIEENPNYLVYIIRDPKAVVISALFYFNNIKDPHLFENISFKDLKNPIIIYYKFKKRIIKEKLINRILIDGMNEEFGSWNKHQHEWYNEIKMKRANIRFAFVSYEDLVNDTFNSIKRILLNLSIDHISDLKINESIKKEELVLLKDKINNMPEEYKIIYKKLLRKGVINDWGKYLSHKEVKKIDGIDYFNIKKKFSDL